MAKVFLKPGGGFTTFPNKSLKENTLQAALSEQAKCHPCGCDDCWCYETICCATTGETLARYYTGPIGGPYVQVIEPLDVAIPNLKALYNART